MIRGILTAALVTLVWISIQIVWMHIKPAKNRFKAMCLGYGLSLPFIYLAFQWLPGLKSIVFNESWGIGLFWAYGLHGLLFGFYAQGFYHVERSVTLRFLVEILRRSPPGAPLQQILAEYNVASMISARLAVLEKNNFIQSQAGLWRLRPKGAWLVQAMRISAWIFQSTPQVDRL